MIVCDFSRNIEKSKYHRIYFKSYKSLHLFTDKYQHAGEILQFDYDIIAEVPDNSQINKKSFKELYKMIVKE